MNSARAFLLLAGMGIALLVSGAEPEKMRTIAKGNFSGVQTSLQLVVTNATQWSELWGKHAVQKNPSEKAPEVDFDKETVIFVALGQQRTGGHAIEIADVKRGDAQVEVLVRTRKPKPGGIQLQAISAPFHAVAVPKISGEVKFKIESAER